MFLKFVILIFGFEFVQRTYKKEIQNGILSEKFLKNWILGTIISVFVFVFGLFGSCFAWWLLFLLSVLVLKLTIFVTKHTREAEFKQEFFNFLDRLALEMQMGRGFRSSLQVAHQFSPPVVQPKLKKIVDAVFFSQNKTQLTSKKFVNDIIFEFLTIDQAPHRALQRLNSFRRRLKVENEIRHKSKQKQKQLKTQSIIMSLMYLGTLFFVILNFNVRQNIEIIAISVFLYLLGTALIFKMGNKNLWRV